MRTELLKNEYPRTNGIESRNKGIKKRKENDEDQGLTDRSYC